MRSLLSVANVLGRLLMIFGIAYLMPIVCAVVYRDGTLLTFVVSLGACLIAGGALTLSTRGYQAELKARDGFILVALAWTLTAAIATVPLILHEQLSFTDAFFETMSGMTTTGATVMVGLDTVAPTINLWRHELNWLGGMGIIVLAVAILPMLGVGGMQLFRAEVPGPIKDARLTARIADTAAVLWSVYFVITLACALSLRLAGMGWFDAICHAFSALSLGGFSTRDASVGAFDSPLIEGVLIFFMVVAALNFATHFTVWRERSFRPYWRDAEVKGVLSVLLVSCLGCAVYLWLGEVYASFWTALRHVSFNLVSIATDCGFVSTDYALWPTFVPFWMLFLSALTASSGSTGGGIKMIRTLILVRQSSRELTRLLHPALAAPVTVGGMAVPNRVVVAILGFIFLYFMSIVAMTFLLIFGGLDFISAFSAVIACINNMGPGLGQVGPAANYAGLTDYDLWVLSFTMLLGRLEVFSLLILLTPMFWRK
ncbi:TrkH family potassium uptake protein [Thiocystis violascens]|uniref:Trk system potassium uptake protein n=1 Tax=Thiocystis violascens (strain ATCC 17096 / DSM 198 / 6111) TaxID=765911 RepID=I3YBW1_THIV6|nr:potassium transporter TrkG [Thiocystis violascens]AFL74479.1 Trk-type K+ transport system, membrane component [Thiocystis violascens DSM 198]